MTWMGRGQQHLWSVGATFYAAVAGAAAFAREDPALAARLRTLAELEFAELQRRRAPVGLAPSPAVRTTLAGMDDSADTISCNGLALVWLHLASSELPGAAGPTAPLPAGPAHDPEANVATLRAGDTWLAVHGAVTHPRDARYDAGSAWPRSAWATARRAAAEYHEEPALPVAGPLLDGVHAASGRIRVNRREISVGRSRFRARPGAVDSGRHARTAHDWTSRSGSRKRRRSSPQSASSSQRARSSSPPVPRLAAGERASAAHEHVRSLRLSTRCTGRPLTITWSAR